MKRAFGLLVLLVVAALYFVGQAPDTRAPSSSSTSNYVPTGAQRDGYSPPLEVQSWRCTKEYDYVFVIGEVKNVSDRRLENVLAVGEFRTSSGELVKAEDALLDYNPILAGQTSPFKAGGTDNPEIKRCNLSFRYLLGGSIGYAMKPSKAELDEQLTRQAKNVSWRWAMMLVVSTESLGRRRRRRSASSRAPMRYRLMARSVTCC